ncbi:hypothetical protein GUY44_03005 [Pimelobacter simplex]|uniref:hypothetical protein n=1 Tax=Nocardioides simplex TaxID=2045 RepID=UPI0008E861BA|nr:hypothetical protein [Pimelobacter simplex]MCG8149435.1 hypothetical protein [Pimelobacter simplex]GEB16194.1 hypothetical protein NSI01_45090 [Pimelobacter simplex]SFM19151.1 hypothetical protein SAMN05421671_0190 [Pimelobacter simplex]
MTYNLTAFKRGFHGGQQPLLLDTAADDTAALAALRDTLSECRSHWQADATHGHPRPWVSGAIATPHGPICRVGHSEPKDAFEPILADIAEGLAQRGITGILKPAPLELHPVFGGGKPNSAYTTLSAVLVLPQDLEVLYANTDPYGRPRYDWFVDRDVTHQVWKAAITWCLDAPGDAYLSRAVQTTQVSPDPDDLLGVLTDVPPTPWGSQFAFAVMRANRTRMRYLSVDHDGLVTLQDLDTASDQGSALTELAAVANTLSPHASITSVRETASGVAGWTTSPTRPDHRPPIDLVDGGIDWWQVLHLLPDYVLDAHVHQVLIDSQLAKTTLHPDRWTVTPLGNGRHAVTATNPQPWLDHSDHTRPATADNRPTGVDATTLARARNDFGDAILTAATLEANPPPLPAGAYSRYRQHHPRGSRS